MLFCWQEKGGMGKLVTQVSIKCLKGDVFEHLKLPYHIAEIYPEVIQSVDLLAGQWGTVGSLILWNYTLDGQKRVAKEIIEAVDEKKKLITFKVIEGNLMEFYNAFRITAEEDSNGEDNLVTWTFEYEKKSEAVPDPHSLAACCMALTKVIERHHSLVPN